MFRKHETSQIREEETFSSKRCLEWFFEYAGEFVFYWYVPIDCPTVALIHGLVSLRLWRRGRSWGHGEVLWGHWSRTWECKDLYVIILILLFTCYRSSMRCFLIKKELVYLKGFLCTGGDARSRLEAGRSEHGLLHSTGVAERDGVPAVRASATVCCSARSHDCRVFSRLSCLRLLFRRPDNECLRQSCSAVARCDSTERLRNSLDYLRSVLNDSTSFKLIYRYAFDFARVSPAQTFSSKDTLDLFLEGLMIKITYCIVFRSLLSTPDKWKCFTPLIISKSIEEKKKIKCSICL